jgi:hypothetical protein
MHPVRIHARLFVRILGFSAAALITSTVSANPSAETVGTITALDGAARLLISAGKNMSGPPPHVLFEGDYYSEREAKVGEKLPPGSILRTAPGAQLRLVYENGDQFNVGPATAYKVQASANPEIKLMYGKIRAIVSKTGPRNHLTIRTRTATMGVRGTDFAVTDRVNRGTEVNVLRGAVALKPETESKNAPPAKAVEVKSGFTAAVPAPVTPPPAATGTATKAEAPAPAPAPVIQVRPSTQQDLAAVARVSEIKKADLVQDESVKKLEEKAKEAVVKEIKTYDPKLYAQIQAAPTKSATELNNLVVTTQAKSAPKGVDKPDESALDEQEVRAYDQYFKIVD